MVELTGRQQQEMQGRLRCHPRLTRLDKRRHVCIFKSSELEGPCIGYFLYLGQARVKIQICQPPECTPALPLSYTPNG